MTTTESPLVGWFKNIYKLIEVKNTLNTQKGDNRLISPWNFDYTNIVFILHLFIYLYNCMKLEQYSNEYIMISVEIRWICTCASKISLRFRKLH